MKSFRSKPVGWRGESYRHYLAQKGVTTKRYFVPRSEAKFLTLYHATWRNRVPRILKEGLKPSADIQSNASGGPWGNTVYVDKKGKRTLPPNRKENEVKSFVYVTPSLATAMHHAYASGPESVNDIMDRKLDAALASRRKEMRTKGFSERDIDKHINELREEEREEFSKRAAREGVVLKVKIPKELLNFDPLESDPGMERQEQVDVDKKFYRYQYALKTTVPPENIQKVIPLDVASRDVAKRYDGMNVTYPKKYAKEGDLNYAETPLDEVMSIPKDSVKDNSEFMKMRRRMVYETVPSQRRAELGFRRIFAARK